MLYAIGYMLTGKTIRGIYDKKHVISAIDRT